MDEQSRNPGLAAVFSFFLTGAGQVYAGAVAAGFAWFVAQVGLIGAGVYLYHQRYGWVVSRQGAEFIGLWLLLLLASKFLAVQHAQAVTTVTNKRRARARLREALRTERLAAREAQQLQARPWVMIPSAEPPAGAANTPGAAGLTGTMGSVGAVGLAGTVGSVGTVGAAGMVASVGSAAGSAGTVSSMADTAAAARAVGTPVAATAALQAAATHEGGGAASTGGGGRVAVRGMSGSVAQGPSGGPFSSEANRGGASGAGGVTSGIGAEQSPLPPPPPRLQAQVQAPGQAQVGPVSTPVRGRLDRHRR
ncbi:MAG: hypothetical protein IMX01_09345 [Limnochordaceae bacterium]|nr:hypothetical protein [Limnochordaceae bacterium]